METIGRLIGRIFDVEQRRQRLTLLVEHCSDEEFERLSTAEKLIVKIEIYREHRSLTANAYFHKLCDLIAEANTWSKARAKNDLITKYGQPSYEDDGEQIFFKTNLTIEKAWELSEPHFKFLKFETDESGVEVYWYKMFRGSHTYDSREMSKLIEGTIADAKDLGIETLPPREIAKMVKRWKGDTNK